MIVAIVSYLNTLPFIYGIERAAPRLSSALNTCVPAECARMIRDGEADIALVPVAVIPSLKNCKIITNFCISAENEVRTVELLSNTPINLIKKIYLDSHSRTSAQLVQIIAREKWVIDPIWVDNLPDNPENIAHGEAVMCIGDKVFELEGKFEYNVDLATEWIEHTGLPFVFAAWVATEKGQQYEQELAQALEFGVEHTAQAIEEYNPKQPLAHTYLTHNIKYYLNEAKVEAMKVFWEKQKIPG